MTHTPASGPWGLDPTPPRSLLPTWIELSARCWAGALANTVLKQAAAATTRIDESCFLLGSLYFLLGEALDVYCLTAARRLSRNSAKSPLSRRNTDRRMVARGAG